MEYQRLKFDVAMISINITFTCLWNYVGAYLNEQ